MDAVEKLFIGFILFCSAVFFWCLFWLSHKVMQQEKEAKQRVEQEKREKVLQKQSRERQPIPDDVKVFVWRRNEGRCVNCGSRESLEFDHIIPVSKGGSNTARNIQLLCEKCNRSKGDSLV